MAGVLIAVLGVVVLVVAFFALRHPKHGATAAGSNTHSSGARTSASSTPSGSTTRSGSTAPSASGSTSPATAIGSQPLIVLSQTSTPDLASGAATRFRTGGWRVTDTQENYQNDVLATTAYFDPAVPGAERAARALARQYPDAIKRVLARFAQLPPGPVVVVLTGDYQPA
ncbi:MAG: LytR C-terminal domain-containing protein [Jatrophihabitantaceae bacterium]